MFINPFFFFFLVYWRKKIFIFCLHVHANSYHAILGKRADEVTPRSFLLLRAAAARFPSEQICTAAEETKFQRRLGPEGNVKVTEFYASI